MLFAIATLFWYKTRVRQITNFIIQFHEQFLDSQCTTSCIYLILKLIQNIINILSNAFNSRRQGSLTNP